MYVDGHERADVVEYCDKTFLPRWAEFLQWMVKYGDDGCVVEIPKLAKVKKPVILLMHDKLTFYANDQRKMQWIHKSKSPKPIQKGDGASIMVADFVSPDLGWLRTVDGCVCNVFPMCTLYLTWNFAGRNLLVFFFVLESLAMDISPMRMFRIISNQHWVLFRNYFPHTTLKSSLPLTTLQHTSNVLLMHSQP